MGREDDDYDWGQDNEERDPMEEAEDQCGLRHDGQCALAGTEHCDFCCPFRDSDQFAGSKAWIAKHSKRT